nr:hypothetical protein [Tanacetum cinerariifolium]
MLMELSKLCNPSINLSQGHRCYLRNRLCRIYLRGGSSVSGISSLRSTGGGMYRGGGSGGSGVDDDGSNSDGTGGGDECADGAVHLARHSPAEGGDSEVSSDGGGVGIARSLSTSAAHGRSKAHNELPDSILLNEPKPLEKHRPPLQQ